MNPNLRIWGLVSGAAVVAVLAGGFFLGVQPQLAAADSAAQAAASTDAQNMATQAKLVSLSKAAAKIEPMKAENAVLLKSVPTILKPNTFIRRVNEVALLNGVTVMSVTPGAAVAYAPPVAVPSANGLPAPELAKGNPLITPANFTVVPVSVVVNGSAGDVLQYSHDIQNDERTFAVTGYQTAKDETTSTVTATISGYIYTLKR